MRVYNPQSDRILTSQLIDLLEKYRFQKNFNVENYIKAKAHLLNDYMKKCSLKSCIVAVSGGIDSACVLSIINYAQKQKDSPIEKIIPVLLPVFNNVGATGQDTATQRGLDVCLSQNLNPFIVPLETSHATLKQHIENQLDIEGNPWSQGQLVSHMRTPSLYYIATLMAQENSPGIICGTTNRDEGLYLGYFGKASDGLVDVQIISDLHKSEVYAVAKYLSNPECVLNVAPTGDMYDGRLDEEVFGAPYDFVEFYMYYLCLDSSHKINLYKKLDQESKVQFDFFSTNLENMHQYNRHKYFGASPAVHFDLDIMLIPESWKTNCTFNRPKDKDADISKYINLQSFSLLPDYFYKESSLSIDSHIIQNSLVYEVKNLLTEEECEWIINELNLKPWTTVGKYGKKSYINESISIKGSKRQSIYSEELSKIILNRLLGHIPSLLYYQNQTQITSPHHIWSLKDINPLFRAIDYKQDDFLIPHYDDTYQFNDFKKTLQSLIIYLNTNIGKTNFLHDDLSIPEVNRTYHDWDNPASNNLISKSFSSIAGNSIIFPHRILHESPSITDHDFNKIILRTDLVYAAPYLGFQLT